MRLRKDGSTWGKIEYDLIIMIKRHDVRQRVVTLQ